MFVNRVVDLGWYQPAGHTGVRLSWHEPTQVLFLFHAATGREEVCGSCDEATARAIGAVWQDRGGPGYVRRSVA